MNWLLKVCFNTVRLGLLRYRVVIALLVEVVMWTFLVLMNQLTLAKRTASC